MLKAGVDYELLVPWVKIRNQKVALSQLVRIKISCSHLAAFTQCQHLWDNPRY